MAGRPDGLARHRPDLAADAGPESGRLRRWRWACFWLLFYWRRRFRARIQEIGEKAAQATCYRFLPTLETAAVDGAGGRGWPGLM